MKTLLMKIKNISDLKFGEIENVSSFELIRVHTNLQFLFMKKVGFSIKSLKVSHKVQFYSIAIRY